MANKTLELDYTIAGLTNCYVEVRHHTNSTFLDSLAAGTFAALPITFPAVTEDADRPGVYQAVIVGVMDDGVYPWRIFQRVGALQDRSVDTFLGGGVLRVENDAEVDVSGLSRVLGLVMENHVEDDIVRDANGLKTSSIIYCYNSAANAAAHDKATGITAKYVVTAAYTSLRMTSLKVVKQ